MFSTKIKLFVFAMTMLCAATSSMTQAADDAAKENALKELYLLVQSIGRIGDRNEGTAVCIQGLPLAKIEAAINDHVRTLGAKESASSEQEMRLGLIKRYPCPFDPRDVPVSLVASSALEGGWALAAGSRRLNTNRFKEDPFGFADCQAIRFFKNGKVGVVEQSTSGACSRITNDDFLGSINNGLEWSESSSGELVINRSRQNAIEIWRVYRVTNDFEKKGAKFLVGDMLLYLTKFGPVTSEGRGTLYFRHFRPMKE